MNLPRWTVGTVPLPVYDIGENNWKGQQHLLREREEERGEGGESINMHM